MSKEHVKSFYERLKKDKAFKTHIETAKSKQECSRIAREAGYDFTESEFEEFTVQLLESEDTENNQYELSEKTLDAVFGGIRTSSAQIYGSVFE